MAGGVYGGVTEIAYRNAGNDVHLAYSVHLIAEKLDADSLIRCISREYLDRIAADAEHVSLNYVVSRDKMARAIDDIRAECAERVKYFQDNGKLLEAQRISQRTNYDIEMMPPPDLCAPEIPRI